MTPNHAYSCGASVGSSNSIKMSCLRIMAGVYLFLVPLSVFGAEISAASITLSPGSSGTIVVSYSSQSEPVSGLQFDLGFDSSALSLLVIPGPSIGAAGKNLYTAGVGAGTSRVLI